MDNETREQLFKYAASLLPAKDMELMRASMADDGEAKKYVVETRRQILGDGVPEVGWDEVEAIDHIREKLVSFALFQLDDASFLRMLNTVNTNAEIRAWVSKFHRELATSYRNILSDINEFLKKP